MNPPPAPPPPPEGLWAPLAHRNFRLLWGGFMVSHVGDFVQVLAQSWLVVNLTPSGLKVGLVAFAQAVPRLVIGLAAGALIDRVDRRRLLLVTQSLAAVQSVVFWGLVHTGRVTYGWVLGLSLALGVLDSLNLNARQALMPSLVPRPMIARAVALQALGVNVTQMLGPTLGGLLLGAWGVEGCLVFNAVTFTVLIGSITAMRLPPSEPVATAGLRGDIAEGLAYVRDHAELWVPIALAWFLGLVGMPLVRLLPLFARLELHATGRGYGLLYAGAGVGAMAASLLVTARARPAELPRNIVVGAVAFGVATALFGAVGSWGAAFVALIAFGAAQMTFRSAVMTLVQTESPDRLRGRIISALTMDFALWSLGAVALGAVVDVVARARAGLPWGADRAMIPAVATGYGLRAVFVASGLACALGGVFASRALQRVADALRGRAG